jgi:hypothetical protein
MSKSVIFIAIVALIAVGVAMGWYYWLNNNQNEKLNQESLHDKPVVIENTQKPSVSYENPQDPTEKQPNNIENNPEIQPSETVVPTTESNSGQTLYNTPQGAINASQVKEEEPQPVAQTYSYITNCNQACTAIGYNSGYCGRWIENNDNTISECANRQEFPFSQSYYDGMKLNDCQFVGDINAKNKVICCCKGEPQNPSECPVIQRPDAPMDCIEQPGYLKNSKTGICCWYRATCYGPSGDSWVEYKTEAECLVK